jgi:hypothetical protein
MHDRGHIDQHSGADVMQGADHRRGRTDRGDHQFGLVSQQDRQIVRQARVRAVHDQVGAYRGGDPTARLLCRVDPLSDLGHPVVELLGAAAISRWEGAHDACIACAQGAKRVGGHGSGRVISEGSAARRVLPRVRLSGILQDAMGLARSCPEVVSESRLGVSFPEMERMRRCKTN